MTEETQNKPTVGILAYGSLISDPGAEIEKAQTNTIHDVMTPFHIEFARSSNGRGGAPTLVPVTTGGAHVRGKVFVMNVSEAEAADFLYRRETGKIDDKTTYKRPERLTNNSVLVERLTNFAGLDVVLYTQIAATITPLTAERLAELAIASVGKTKPNRDGIVYLINAKKHGIETALSPAYEAEILKETKCKSLDEAHEKLLHAATK